MSAPETTVVATLEGLSESWRPLSAMSLRDIEALRLVLNGGSVVDWRRLAFQSRDEVNELLELYLFDPGSPADEGWMRGILRDAVAYLRETFRYRVAQAVAEPEEIHDLFLFASGQKGPRYRKIACIVLKVMHVIHHIEGRDLLYRTDLSEERLSQMAEERVMNVCREMMTAGFPIAEASGSVKGRASLITKLLAKKETLAAQIYDKTRFRIVTETADDVLPVLHQLTRRLFPFNLVLPGQTENSLIDFKRVAESTPEWSRFLSELHLGLDYEVEQRRERRRKGQNEFSGRSYQVLNFIVDLPLRIDAFLTPEVARQTRARVVFLLVELQLIDQLTAAANEQGDNSHERYKHRQKLKVLRRLSRGLVVPKRR